MMKFRMYLVLSFVVAYRWVAHFIFSSTLMRCGLLSMRDLHSFWLGVPGAGAFRKQYVNGRSEILKLVEKSKFKEILFKVNANGCVMRDAMQMGINICSLFLGPEEKKTKEL